VLLYFGDDVDGCWDIETIGYNSERLVDWRQVFSFKLDVENRTDDLNYFANVLTAGTTVSARRRHTLFELLFDLLRRKNWAGLKARQDNTGTEWRPNASAVQHQTFETLQSLFAQLPIDLVKIKHHTSPSKELKQIFDMLQLVDDGVSKAAI
jgi:hypothetical protein